MFKNWILAARPRTVPAAISPVFVGWAIAFNNESFRWDIALVLLGVSLLLQINANLINDVVDFQKGLDTNERLGPLRVTQSGLLTPRQVWTGVGVVFLVAGMLGIYLAMVAGFPVIVMGLLAFSGAMAYSTGPFPLAEKGLGDLGVILFFGFLAVCGTVFVLTGTVPAIAWWGGLAVGGMVTNVLVINNLRDIQTDRIAGRHTLPVVFGYRGGELEYNLMIGMAYLIPVGLWIERLSSVWVILPWLTLFEAIRLSIKIHHKPDGPAFNPLLAETARLSLFFSILFALGIVLGK